MRGQFERIGARDGVRKFNRRRSRIERQAQARAIHHLGAAEAGKRNFAGRRSRRTRLCGEPRQVIVELAQRPRERRGRQLSGPLPARTPRLTFPRAVLAHERPPEAGQRQGRHDGCHQIPDEHSPRDRLDGVRGRHGAMRLVCTRSVQGVSPMCQGTALPDQRSQSGLYPRIHPLNLSVVERHQLSGFLQMLSGVVRDGRQKREECIRNGHSIAFSASAERWRRRSSPKWLTMRADAIAPGERSRAGQLSVGCSSM